MKKLLFLFAGLILLTSTGCKKEDTTPEISIVGTWKPLKMIENTVIDNGLPHTNVYYMTPCQQESRWVFNDDGTGKKFVRDDVNNLCYTMSDETFSYTWDKKTGALTIKYITFSDNGYAMDVKDTTMNLKIETMTPTKYHSETYSLVKVK